VSHILENSKWKEKAAQSDHDSVHMFDVNKAGKVMEFVIVRHVLNMIMLIRHFNVLCYNCSEHAAHVYQLADVCEPADSEREFEEDFYHIDYAVHQNDRIKQCFHFLRCIQSVIQVEGIYSEFERLNNLLVRNLNIRLKAVEGAAPNRFDSPKNLDCFSILINPIGALQLSNRASSLYTITIKINIITSV